ncbi:PepSY-like domain-containing protein [Flavilitoribacter nigricans]|uniref:Putative beta-lactamase-inhibitor-like PepSY-like domain-containing protein n=1 Tax=Flavilitoribacter nigricans (strain ATCC 23147 / DSM 23189 / NBRC 102662 / NCIMB 1420 / SS-2) TaxID=1122177 RepID=A0A2D0N8U8_FLAN2|nr:PepSY-like domain-containing protein [Flavilitoribacter nigricans]PHN04810.1 hypothetical protein CRP01_20075 [Flavilitoribacter nigricans DSM 23189 = NBRC 102662]
MRSFINYLPVLGLTLLLTSCSGIFTGDDDDSGVNPGDLAASITDYIKDNYSGYNIEDIEIEDICDVLYYEVELEDGPGPDIELYFNMAEEFVFAATEVSKDVLPQAVLDVIAQQYANYSIDDDKIEQFELVDGSLQFEVELETDSGSDLEIVFNADGSVFCQDDSDDDKGDDD